MIGVFDSGVGGLTIVKELFTYLPECQVIYFGDTARLPYGTKGAGFVKKYSAKISDWLLHHGAHIIVVACNTASAWAAEDLAEQFKPIPVFEMIEPAVNAAVKATKNKKVGIIGTPGTIRSGAYQKHFLAKDASIQVHTQSCPLLVPLVEEGLLEDKVTLEILQRYLEPLKKAGIDTLVLGCTHYPLLEKTIKKIVGAKITIINPAETLAKNIQAYLATHPEISKTVQKGSEHQFFFSDQPYHLDLISKLCFEKTVVPTVEDPFYE